MTHVPHFLAALRHPRPTYGRDLFDAYIDWCEYAGLRPPYRLDRRALFRALRAAGATKSTTRTGSVVLGGIDEIAPADPAMVDAFEAYRAQRAAEAAARPRIFEAADLDALLEALDARDARRAARRISTPHK